MGQSELPEAHGFEDASHVWFGVDELGKAWWRIDTVMSGAATASYAILPDQYDALMAAMIETLIKAEETELGYGEGEADWMRRYTPADARAKLDAMLAEAREEGRRAGIEQAAKLIDQHADDYDREFGSYDYSTGVTEYPGTGEEWMEEWETLTASIRALTDAEPPRSVTVDILTMQLSGDRYEHYVRIACEGRTTEVRKYGGQFYNRALYERDTLRHVLCGGPKPDLMAPEYADPKDGTCVGCGCAPVNSDGFCAACVDKPAPRNGEDG